MLTIFHIVDFRVISYNFLCFGIYHLGFVNFNYLNVFILLNSLKDQADRYVKFDWFIEQCSKVEIYVSIKKFREKLTFL